MYDSVRFMIPFVITRWIIEFEKEKWISLAEFTWVFFPNLAWYFPCRVFTASPAKWLVAYGHVYSLLMDMNSLYVVSTRSEQIVAEFSLPPFRRSVRGSNFTPGETLWLDGLVTSPRESLVFATSMPDYSVLLLMLKEGTWRGIEPIVRSLIITQTAWVREFVRSMRRFFGWWLLNSNGQVYEII